MNKLQQHIDLDNEFVTSVYEENLNWDIHNNVETTDADNEILNTSNNDIVLPSTCENYMTNQDSFENDHDFNVQHDYRIFMTPQNFLDNSDSNLSRKLHLIQSENFR